MFSILGSVSQHFSHHLQIIVAGFEDGVLLLEAHSLAEVGFLSLAAVFEKEM